MASHIIPSTMRELVINRASKRCEYCLIHQDFSIYSHEIDHIIPLKHGGQTTTDNLALACLPCNRHKGTDFATFAPTSREITLLFNPRSQNWLGHFYLQNSMIQGITATGKVTASLLIFNQSKRVLQRQILILKNCYPNYG